MQLTTCTSWLVKISFMKMILTDSFMSCNGFDLQGSNIMHTTFCTCAFSIWQLQIAVADWRFGIWRCIVTSVCAISVCSLMRHESPLCNCKHGSQSHVSSVAADNKSAPNLDWHVNMCWESILLIPTVNKPWMIYACLVEGNLPNRFNHKQQRKVDKPW